MKPFNTIADTAGSAPKPLALRVIPNIAAFLIGLSIAYSLNWQTTDLVWSLWLCSLVIGYLTILSAITRGAYSGLRLIKQTDSTETKPRGAIITGLGTGLFFLAFFSIHFCGFHAGHSVFLQQFFPLESLPEDGFGEAFTNPLLLWEMTLTHLMLPYGAFIIPALLAERKHIFKPLSNTVSDKAETPTNISGKQEAKRKQKKIMQDAMSRPYSNVIRMHLLIFFFAFCHFIKIDSFMVYATVYSAYFFPWSEFKNMKPTK